MSDIQKDNLILSQNVSVPILTTRFKNKLNKPKGYLIMKLKYVICNKK